MPNAKPPPNQLATAFPSPAKINLFLRVLGRRDDGYHELHTHYQFLDFADSLSFSVTAEPTIRRIDQHRFALPELDLSLRAARLLQQRIRGRTKPGVTITLQKRIPPGSGLGGGSSNAATTLLALNRLWGVGLGNAELAALGLELGVDVPVFVRGVAAQARGRGEILTPQDAVECWVCLYLAAVEVATAEVFSKWIQQISQTKSSTDFQVNDLEPICAALYPEVAALIRHLAKHGEARLSGSGGAVYASFADPAAAQRAVEDAPPNCRAVLTHSRNRHPLVGYTA